MKKNFLILLILLSVLSCEKDKGNDSYHRITGKVILKGVFGERISDLSNVSVSLNDEFFTLTNSYGIFEFKNIPRGVYKMKIEKDDFEPLNCIEIEYSGNDTTLPYDRDEFTLSKHPRLENILLSIDNNGNALVTGKCLDAITSINEPKLDIILLGNATSFIDKENYYYLSPGYGLINLNSDGTFRFEFSVNGVYGQSLNKVYYKVYIASKGSVNNSLGTGCNFYVCSNNGSDIIEYVIQ
jgi:hypothetical protein